ncbi:GIY-YIG nuclease family protein [Clostridium sp. YIM B02515]|uniref:GIY-YIG nuclease family protein n=1 Tax=Clostridium rhizosphaerae TaxID=2803861 RepID=A0ABS1TD85_9CLOT|nr:GIY-YIG nuclease family protein [Clostridium rhizosphaerae]MBL4937062.1 GIY-YIG nuclease family protein [Clostridium rhizosphaerae]
MTGLYIIKNTINDMFYVGHSVDIERRFRAHKSYLIRNIHHCVYLQRVWNKYGEENFEFIILKECSLEESIKLEQYYIDNFKKSIYNTGDLAASGGDLISNNPNIDNIRKKKKQDAIKYYSRLTDEEKKEKYGRKGDKNPMYGKHHTDEVRKLLSEKAKRPNPNKGKKIEEIIGYDKAKEVKKILSEKASQKIGEKNPFYGKTHSNRIKEKLRERMLGSRPTNIRPVSIEGIIYESVTDASRRLDVCLATIIYRIKSSSEQYKSYGYLDI